jgi:hypothetical protein
MSTPFNTGPARGRGCQPLALVRGASIQAQKLRGMPIKNVVFEVFDPAANKVLADIKIQWRNRVIMQQQGFRSRVFDSAGCRT